MPVTTAKLTGVAISFPGSVLNSTVGPERRLCSFDPICVSHRYRVLEARSVKLARAIKSWIGVALTVFTISAAESSTAVSWNLTTPSNPCRSPSTSLSVFVSRSWTNAATSVTSPAMIPCPAWTSCERSEVASGDEGGCAAINDDEQVSKLMEQAKATRLREISRVKQVCIRVARFVFLKKCSLAQCV